MEPQNTETPTAQQPLVSAPTPETQIPNPTNVPISPTQKKFFLIPLLILLLLILGAGGILLGKHYLTPKKQISKEVLPTPTQNPTPTINQTAGWETYTNNDLGYSIKHSTNWILGETPASAKDTIRFDPQDTRNEELTSFYIYVTSQTKEGFINEWSNNGRFQPNTIVINGVSATRLDTENSTGGKVIEIFIPTLNKTFSLSAPSATNPITKQEVEGMISSFKLEIQN